MMRGRPFVGYGALAAVYLLFVLYALARRAVPTVDDAAIVFRYVELILAGQGIVYNAGGDHVYGSSSLPYAFVLVMLGLAGVRPETAALIVNLLSLAAAVALLYSLCVRGSEPDDSEDTLPGLLALIPCALALFQGTSLVWITQGLESGFHLLLCIACVWSYDRRKEVLSGLLLAAALMNKLDAVAVLSALTVVHFWRERRLPVRIALTALAAYVPWLAFTTWYFGSIIPMSLQAKTLGEFASAGHQVLLHYLDQPYGVVLAVGAVFLARRRFSQVLTAWLIAYVALYDVVSRGRPFPWYYFPADLVLYFLAGLTIASLFVSRRLSGVLGHAPKIVSVLALLVAARHNLLAAGEQLRGLQSWSATIEADRVDIGQWLKRYAAPGESVGTAHGWIQYLSGLHVYDYSGLNDPDMVRLKRAGRASEYLLLRRPYYLVGHDLVPPAALQDQYVLLARFTRTKKGTGWPDWNLWGRRDCAALQRLDVRQLPLIFPPMALIE